MELFMDAQFLNNAPGCGDHACAAMIHGDKVYLHGVVCLSGQGN